MTTLVAVVVVVCHRGVCEVQYTLLCIAFEMKRGGDWP